MNKSATAAYEQQAEKAFSKQSAVFDETYSNNTIIQYKRKRVRDHVEQFLNPASRILELNAGTGEDAIYFAKKGHQVHATDISEGMQKELRKKLNEQNLNCYITTELRSYSELENLEQKGPYDFIFSNFAGLNCTNDIEKVLTSLAELTKPAGVVTLVILPKFCLWETALMFRGKLKTAFRRFFSRKGRTAKIENEIFRCWYYNPSLIQKILRKDFELLHLEGLCTFVPPSYIKNFAEKYPKRFDRLRKWEDKWKSNWPWRSVGDYYIISFRRKFN
jgi:ubiquinone/menaquinone biosynthesis C-methylase UbiE